MTDTLLSILNQSLSQMDAENYSASSNQSKCLEPGSKVQPWQWIDMQSICADNYRFKQSEKHCEKATTQEDLTSNTITFINGYYVPELSVLPTGVTIDCSTDEGDDLNQSMCGIIRSDHQLFASIPHVKKQRYTLKLSGLANLKIRHNITGSNTITANTIILKCEDASNCTIQEYYHLEGNHCCVENRWVHVSTSAKFRLTTHKNLSEKSNLIRHLVVNLEQDAQMVCADYAAGGKLNHQYTQVNLNKKKAEFEFKGLTLAGMDEQHGHQVKVNHHQGYTKSKQFHRSVVDGSAKSIYSGLIYVHPHAQKVESQQMNHHLILADRARAVSLPQLEIHADDVVCQHGSTTGALSTDLLWYMMSRGLDKVQAKKLLIQSFIADVIDNCSKQEQEALLDQVKALLDKKTPINAIC